MTAPRTLLPDNRQPFEMAVSLTSAERRPLDADMIRRVRLPWECPAAALPFLAHALGVRLWYEDWSEFRKRSIVAESLILREREGTLAGVEGYLKYVDARVVRAQRPPGKIFLSGGITDADREAYLASLPQIRVYPFQERVTPPASRAFLGRRAVLGRMVLQASRGPELYGRRATLQRPGGPEVDATVSVEPGAGGIDAERITIAGFSTRRAFLGKRAFLGHMHLQASRAASMTMLVRLSDEALGAFVGLSGALLQDVRPVRVYSKRTAPLGRFFLGRDHLGSKRAHLCASVAERMIFDRIALYDPAVDPPLRKGRSYLGTARFGVPAFTAEVMVELPLTRSPWRAGLGRTRLGLGRTFLRPASGEPIERLRAALGAAKAVDDTLLIDTEVFRRTRLGGGLRVGQIKLGAYSRRIKGS